jgi:hypothetical protein
MPLPEIIPIRYTEEEAGYVSVRPVVHQTFRIRDLAGMVIRVTGKDPARVRQIFRAGAVVYNSYRYWWAGFEADDRQLAGLLATFPEDDPSRRFRVEECTAVFLETGGGAACRQLEITRVEAGRKPFWRRGSVWGILLPVENAPLAYVGYSHAQGGDLYRRAPTREEATRLLQQLFALAPRALRARLMGLAPPSALLYLCPRQGSDPPRS